MRDARHGETGIVCVAMMVNAAPNTSAREMENLVWIGKSPDAGDVLFLLSGIPDLDPAA